MDNPIISNYEVQAGFIIGKTWKGTSFRFFNSSLPYSILNAKRQGYIAYDNAEYSFIISVKDLTTGKILPFEMVVDAEYQALKEFIKITGD